MKLAEFQENFQQAILTGDPKIVDALDETPGFDCATRLGVYVNAYRLRLAEFISKDYPVLRDVLGDEEFEALAIMYVDHTQSRHFNARSYASNLPEFMSAHARWRLRDEWIDLARFERALCGVFDAADAPVLDMNGFSTVTPQQAPGLRLEFHPSVRLLELKAGTAGRYAVMAGGEETATKSEGREHVLFWRQDEQCFHRKLAEDESLALSEGRNGRRFDDICGLLAFRHSEANVAEIAASFLLRWFQDGLVSAIAF